ncbi:MAG: ABC transporter substrate-binding protein [Syntrophorhabdales bacterium]
MKQRISMCLAISLFVSLGLVALVAAAKPAAAAEPIKIGAVFSVTGWAGPVGTPAKEAVEIATDEINKKGGVLGRNLEVYYEDDQSNPTNSAIAATKLIRDRNVCILLGSSLTVFTMPMVPVVEREQITLMAFGAGHELTSPIKKWVFRIPMTDYRVSPIMLKFATEVLGAKKLALLHSTDSSGTMGAKGVVDTVANYGASVIITERFEPADTNMVPQLTRIKAANPDAVILYTSAAPAAVIAKNYQQLGMKTPVVTSHGVPSQEFLNIAGKIAEAAHWAIVSPKVFYAWTPPPDDPYRKNVFDPFVKTLKERFGKEITGFHANGYDALYMVAQALTIAGTDDRAAVRDAMEKVRYKGLLASWNYTPTDHDGQNGEELYPLMVKDGKWYPYKK